MRFLHALRLVEMTSGEAPCAPCAREGVEMTGGASCAPCTRKACRRTSSVTDSGTVGTAGTVPSGATAAAQQARGGNELIHFTPP